ncbi:DUF3613 domain-containing protein [Thioalkalivibrio nitratireducens]|nr:DUF3613 domain-containing protein [Thioalkalivibrio nitratireducens]
MSYRIATPTALAALALCAGVFLAPGAWAEADSRAPVVIPPPAPGLETRGWLELQASGALQSPHPQALRDAEAERAYERHLQSFTHRIPETFVDRSGFAP